LALNDFSSRRSNICSNHNNKNYDYNRNNHGNNYWAAVGYSSSRRFSNVIAEGRPPDLNNFSSQQKPVYYSQSRVSFNNKFCLISNVLLLVFMLFVFHRPTLSTFVVNKRYMIHCSWSGASVRIAFCYLGHKQFV